MGKRKSKGRSPTRFSESVGRALSSHVWDWPSIEKEAAIHLSAEARRRIEWAESWYRLRATGFETMAWHQFIETAEKARADLQRLQDRIGGMRAEGGREREGPFGAAMRTALISTGPTAGCEWDECLASLDRMAELLARAPAAAWRPAGEDSRPAASIARERYIREVAWAMEADGLPTAAHVGEDGSASPLVRLLCVLGLQKGMTEISSFVREVQEAKAAS